MIIIFGKDRYRLKLIRAEEKIRLLESPRGGNLTGAGFDRLLELKADVAELRAILKLDSDGYK